MAGGKQERARDIGSGLRRPWEGQGGESICLMGVGRVGGGGGTREGGCRGQEPGGGSVS